MSEILNDPIEWARDSSLDDVPEEISVAVDVQGRWSKINVTVFDGTPVDHDIKAVEEAIISRKNLIAAGSLRPDYDWKHDLELARYSHRFHLANLQHVRNKRVSYIDFWRAWSSDATSYFREISLNGQKTIYLLHGAIALGALNILTGSNNPPQLIFTAKIAIVLSAVGIILAGAGQLTSFYFGSALTHRIRGKLIGDVKWAKVRALPRYVRRFGRTVDLGDRAIYASMIWFGVYLIILLIMLLS